MNCNIKNKDYISLAAFIIVILGIGMSVGALTATSIPTWFAKLKYPFLLRLTGYLLQFGRFLYYDCNIWMASIQTKSS